MRGFRSPCCSRLFAALVFLALTSLALNWVHCTGDIRTATLRVGETVIHDRGRLAALDRPEVVAIAERYPGRPGLGPQPRVR